jgi:hypothetical protein
VDQAAAMAAVLDDSLVRFARRDLFDGRRASRKHSCGRSRRKGAAHRVGNKRSPTIRGSPSGGTAERVMGWVRPGGVVACAVRVPWFARLNGRLEDRGGDSRPMADSVRGPAGFFLGFRRVFCFILLRPNPPRGLSGVMCLGGDISRSV